MLQYKGAVNYIVQFRGIVILKLPIQRSGRRIAENIVISGTIDRQGGES